MQSEIGLKEIHKTFTFERMVSSFVTQNQKFP